MLSQPCGSEARKASRTWRSPGPSAPHAEQRRGLRRGSRCGSGQGVRTSTGRATAALGTRPRQPHSSTQRGSCGLSTLPGLAVQRLLWLCELCNGDDDKSSTASGRTSRVRGGAPPGGPEACGRRAMGGGGLALRPLVFAALSPTCCPQAQKDECGETTRVSIHLAYSGCSDRKPSDQAPPEGTAPEVHNETV